MENKIKQQNNSDCQGQLTPPHDPPTLSEIIGVIQISAPSCDKSSQLGGKFCDLGHRVMDTLKHIIQFRLGYNQWRAKPYDITGQGT